MPALARSLALLTALVLGACGAPEDPSPLAPDGPRTDGDPAAPSADPDPLELQGGIQGVGGMRYVDGVPVGPADLLDPAPTEGTITYRVEVTPTGLHVPGDPGPGIPLEVGAIDPEGRRVPRARVRTDAAGFASGQLELVAGSPHWYAIPLAVGWQSRAHEGRAVLGRPSNLRVQMVPGGTLRGHLVDPEGRPSAGQVVLSRNGGFVDECQLHARGLEPGAFELHYTFQDLHHVRAFLEGVGGVCVDDVDLRRDRAPDELRLQLQGTCRVGGRVVDADGRPLTDTLVVIAPYFSEEDSLSELRFWSRSPTTSDGLRIDRARTDMEGRYELAGLAPGTYTIACDPFDRGRLDGPRVEVTLPRDDPAEPLVVPAQRWRVRVMEEGAEAFALERQRSEARLLVQREADGGLAGETRVEIRVPDWIPGVGQLPGAGRVAFEPWRPTSDPTAWDLVLPPGGAYVLQLTAPDRPPVSRALPVGEGLRAADLVLPENPGLAHLRLRTDLADEQDEPASYWEDALDHLLVEVRYGSLDVVQVRSEWSPWEPLELALPPGPYRVEVTPVSGYRSRSRARRVFEEPLMPYTEVLELELAAHQALERTVTFTPRTGLLVEVLAPTGAERTNLQARVLARPPGGPTRELHVLVSREGGVDPDTGRPTYRSEASTLFPTGTLSLATDDLAPGTYELWAECGELTGPVHRVELDAGRRAKVRLRLVPEPDPEDGR